MRRNKSARWGVALALLLLGSAAQAAGAELPEIVGCHVGLGDHYKLGCWAPVRVDVSGGAQPLGVGVVLAAPDSDGASVATTTPGARPLSTEPGRTSQATLYTRVGRSMAPLEARLVAGGRVIHQRRFGVEFQAGPPDGSGQTLNEGVLSTERLYLQLSGPADEERADMLLDLATLQGYNDSTHVAFVHSPAELPREAIGYDSFDAVLLVAGRDASKSQAGWLAGLSADDLRVQALAEWVRSGGRLVLSCGARGEELLGPGGPLAALCPGQFVETTPLASAAAIDSYTDAPEETPAIDLAGAPLPVSKIRAPRGVVEAFGGRDRTETPLVVRSPLGFGEVTFVAFDLDAPAIASWGGRSTLLRKLMRQEAPDEDGYGSNEFVYRLSELLDQSFSGVRTTPFLLVVGLVIGYLMLIGPGDYFFVKNVLKRVEATWVTFPLIVVLTSAAAYAAAYWIKGDALRVSRVEVIDVDAATGVTRGALFTHLFSPRSARYDLSLATQSLGDEPLDLRSSWTSWVGRPNWGLGGMHSPSSSGLGTAGYRVDATPTLSPSGDAADVTGLPVQVWSTKTLLSRYTARVDRSVESQLTPNREGLVSGPVTNDTGAALTNCWLLYGSWAWRLGDLADGATKTVDPSVVPIKITTMLRDRSDPQTFRGVVDEVTLGRRREGSAGASRYLGDLDLSLRLDGGEALMITRVGGGPCCRLVGPDGAPLIDPAGNDPDQPADKSWVFARFALPVGEQE